jgi:hypothetical protein
MNCSPANDDPEGGEDLSDRGLWPLGVEIEKEGKSVPFDSGVRGGIAGMSTLSFSGASSSVAELIHFSSVIPRRGGESGKTRNKSA